MELLLLAFATLGQALTVNDDFKQIREMNYANGWFHLDYTIYACFVFPENRGKSLVKTEDKLYKNSEQNNVVADQDQDQSLAEN